MTRSEQEKAIAKVEEADHWEIERLRKELQETKISLEKLRGHNYELNDRIQEVNLTTVTNKKKIVDITVEEEEIRNKMRRQLSEQMLNVHKSDN